MAKKLLAGLGFLMVLAVSVFAEVGVDLYGKVKLGSWWDKELDFTDDKYKIEQGVDANNNPIVIPFYGPDPDPLYYMEMYPTGALGLDITSDKYDFCFEMGVGKNLYDYRTVFSQTSGFFYGTRRNEFARINCAFVDYHFNENISLLLGKDATPCNFSVSNQGLFGGNGFGNTGVMSTGSKAQLRFSAKTKVADNISINGQIAGIVPDTMTMPLMDFRAVDTVVNGATMAYVTAAGIIQENNYRASVSIPKMEAAFNCEIESGFITGAINAAGGYLTYDVLYKLPAGMLEEQDRITSRETLESYVFGGCGEVKAGPVSLAATYSRGKNFGVYGVDIGNPFKWRAEGIAGSAGINVYFPWAAEIPVKYHDIITYDSLNEIKTHLLDNSYTQEYAFIGKITPFKSLSIEGGVGFVTADHDNKKFFVRDSTNSVTVEKTTIAWYAQLEYTYADFVTISPEYGFYNYGKWRYNGTYTYWGFNTSINIAKVKLK